MSSLPKFHAYLNQVNPDYSEDQILPLTRSLLKTLQLLSIPADGVVQTTDVVAALTTNNHIINGEQQDAQELYQLLMDALGNELENNDNMAENPVNGLFGYRITCTKCEYSVNIYQVFYLLILMIIFLNIVRLQFTVIQ